MLSGRQMAPIVRKFPSKPTVIWGMSFNGVASDQRTKRRGSPTDLWRALQRFAVWIEPALISEWCRLMRAYAGRQGKSLDEGALNRAMIWADPARDVALPRERSLQLMAGGRRVDCVWSGRRLDARSLDIDHGLPWSAWPCSDLWNLLPAHRAVNQHQKNEIDYPPTRHCKPPAAAYSPGGMLPILTKLVACSAAASSRRHGLAYPAYSLRKQT
jgi:HNH endonuclease